MVALGAVPWEQFAPGVWGSRHSNSVVGPEPVMGGTKWATTHMSGGPPSTAFPDFLNAISALWLRIVHL